MSSPLRSNPASSRARRFTFSPVARCLLMMILRVSITLHDPPFDVLRSSYDTLIERASATCSSSASETFIIPCGVYGLSIADYPLRFFLMDLHDAHHVD